MRTAYLFFVMLLYSMTIHGQAITERLNKAVKNLEVDSQMRHGIISLCVADGKTEKVIYERHSQIGLVPASTQKIITSATAFELLGKEYRYKTSLGYGGKIENGFLKGNLFIIGSGDPTLGSWRFNNTKEEVVISEWIKAIQNLEIKKIQGVLTAFVNFHSWSSATIPDGWIWQDIGNYYGAGADILNWRENQYDLILCSGNSMGDSVEMLGTKPKLFNTTLVCEVLTGARNSGDNAYIYLPPYSDYGFVRGTIPIGEKEFTISGSFPIPTSQLISTITENIKNEKIQMASDIKDLEVYKSFFSPILISTHYSPSLDSINYWFLQKSINLYGEALIKTLAYEKTGYGSTEKGVELVKDFWAQRGIDKSAINIMDGSGLSPQNRVTTDALVKILKYAKTQPWFPSFYSALPEYNGMKMKSGSINGVRSYAGYHKSKGGKEWVFAIIINNYDGSGNELVKKMYKVLDSLK